MARLGFFILFCLLFGVASFIVTQTNVSPSILTTARAEGQTIFIPSKSIHQMESEKYKDVHPTQLQHESDIYIPEFDDSSSSGNNQAVKPSSIPIVRKTVFGFHPYWSSGFSDYNFSLLSHIGYFAIELNANGSVGNTRGWPDHGLVNTAHQNGVKVVIVAKNFSSSDLSTLLGSSENRSRAIASIISQIQAGNADGVNIDFENLPSSRKSEFVTFLADLSAQTKTAVPGAHISIDIPSVDWSDAFDIPRLADISDALIMMGYDYHYPGSAQAGPVAPYSSSAKWGSLGVLNSIHSYMDELGTSRSGKLVLGVPYYGYDWPTENSSVPSNTTDNAFSRTYANIRSNFNDSDRKWDGSSRTPYYIYNSSPTRQLWYEDASSLSLKYDIVNNQELGGIAMWALGYDSGRDELWNMINEKFGDESIANRALRIITAPGPGGGPHVRAFSTGGSVDTTTNFFAYGADFHGGLYLGTGDIDNDGQDEIITGPAAGGGPQLRVFERDGTQRGIQFFPFHQDFHGGMTVDGGDVDGDGKDEIGVCQASQGQAWCKVYRYNDEKTILAEWNVFGAPEVGASIAFGDVDLDGKEEVIIGAGPGGGPHVRVYDIGTSAISGPNQGATLKSIQFFAFHPLNRSGIYVSAADTDGDGKVEIAASQRTGDEAWVKVYRYNNDKTVLGNFRAYPQGVYSGAFIDMGDIDNDGRAEIVTGPGNTGGPQVRAFEVDGTPLSTNFFAYDAGFRGGTRPVVAGF